MTTLEMARAISAKTGFPVQDIQRILEAERKIIVATVAAGDQVTYRRFGTFHPVKRKAKKARNILTKTDILVPARVVPIFKASPQFNKTVLKKAS